jgi:predicted nucleic acid-binding protein
MQERIFLDTNLWVYLYSRGQKSGLVSKLIDQYYDFITISTQILGEVYTVLTKKGFKQAQEAQAVILDLSNHFNVTGINKTSVSKAITLSQRYKYSYWDSLILASALEQNCSRLYSEDLQAGQIIGNNLKIVNPFILK